MNENDDLAGLVAENGDLSVTEDPSAAVAVEPALPEKFAGKSAAEIATAYGQLEQAYGRQSGEIGELRGQVNQVLMNQMANSETGKAEQEEAIDFSYEPEKSVTAVVRRETKDLREELQRGEQARAFEAFKSKHPDYIATAKDPDFEKWVKGSEFRQARFNDANGNGNLRAADEVMTDWAEHKALVSTISAKETAAVETAGANLESLGTGTGATDTPTGVKQTFMRSALRDLKVSDPARYVRLGPVIMAAYREGRVI